MGLDISAYGTATPDPRFEDPDSIGPDDWDDVTWIYVNTSFPAQADGLQGGAYRVTNTHAFRAGSYSGYNEWRRWLCRMALGCDPQRVWEDPESFTGQPFVELIHFSDCEGTIGPNAAAKLAQDFAVFQRRAEMEGVDPEQPGYARTWKIDRYNEWRKAFEMAAGTGMVCLH